MVQLLSIIFFSWISSIFVGYFKSSRFLGHPVYTRICILFSVSKSCIQFPEDGQYGRNVQHVRTKLIETCCIWQQYICHVWSKFPNFVKKTPLLWTRNIRYRIDKSLSLHPILKQMKPIHTLKPFFLSDSF